MSSAVTGMLCLLACLPMALMGQTGSSPDSAVSNISTKLSNKYIGAIGGRSAEYQTAMQQNTEKYLEKLKNKELLMQKQLSKMDTSAAAKVFSGTAQTYTKLENDLKNNSENMVRGCGKYVPGIDSAITSLKFLEQSGVAGKLGSNVTQVTTAMSKVKALEDQFKKTDNVEDFIKQREAYLQQQLSSYNLPGLQQYKQEAAYYAQTMSELKEDWDDPSRIESKAITILNKIPAFQDFMKTNSLIAGLFNIPDDYSGAGLGGLQTRDQVQAAMQQQMGNMGAAGAQTAQQNIGDGQSALTDLRSKLNSGSSELAMPAGQRNSQHTKSLFKRIQYGFDMQSSKSNLYFPNQTIFTVTAGYILTDGNTIGIGIGYTVGWGKDIQHISITNQGIGFRSFGDFKIKGSFYGSGGFEYNYAYPFQSFSQINSSGLWQRSGLIGITKMVSIRSHLVKKTKLQLLWNFLSYYQMPKTQPIVFRVGYNF